ncbi:glycosyltransferase family 2 protein [Celeribacter sp.]|uniref:glycosyltransferase family 2 protein n=1 Tax=Celeribacter sp. TaxID=1890673 RepID=UPI003A938A4D
MTVSIQPEFSVVITCYNKSSTVAGAIKSVQAQNSNCEIIVVDDCSTDTSREVLAQFSDINVILHDVNKGALQAYLTGMRVAQGRFIVMLDGDDALADGILEELSNAEILDDTTSIRMGIAQRKDATNRTGAPSGVRVNITFRPGWLFAATQSTGGAANIFPNTLFKEVDQALGQNWPDIVVQDHILPGMLAFVSRRVLKLSNVGYLIPDVPLDRSLGQKRHRMDNDRLLSDQALAAATFNPAFSQGWISRVLLQLALVIRIRRLGRKYGVATRNAFGLLLSSRQRNDAVDRISSVIRSSPSF